uniref:Uncharacterized protein n=1 Tax=Anguilla anguilla TaxID=7936 RepID=A0A0E9XDN3_ANGAN
MYQQSEKYTTSKSASSWKLQQCKNNNNNVTFPVQMHKLHYLSLS